MGGGSLAAVSGCRAGNKPGAEGRRKPGPLGGAAAFGGPGAFGPRASQTKGRAGGPKPPGPAFRARSALPPPPPAGPGFLGDLHNRAGHVFCLLGI